MVYAGCHGDSLTFFPTFGSPIGAPPLPGPYVRVLASANGLLCLECHLCCLHTSLYVCNPATREGYFVTEHDESIDSVGLAFDPVTSPDHYKLVHPLRRYVFMNGIPTAEYGFTVFSSKTNQWVESSQKVLGITSIRRDGKPIFVKGALYWDCDEYVLSFDPEKDLASYVRLPEHRQPPHFHQEIEACDGRVTCTRLDCKNMQVWIMSVDMEGWESKYLVSMDEAIEGNRDVFSCFCSVMKKRSSCRSPSEMLFYGHDVWPLPFGGGERLHFQISSRRLKEQGKAEVFSYDLRTGKVEKLCVFQFKIRNYFKDQRTFLYHNSMVRLPKLLG